MKGTLSCVSRRGSPVERNSVEKIETRPKLRLCGSKGCVVSPLDPDLPRIYRLAGSWGTLPPFPY